MGVLSRSDSYPVLGSLDAFLSGDAGELLAPVDLQAVKAAGVTFADSMLERVIEEQARVTPLERRRSARSWRLSSATICAALWQGRKRLQR